MSATIRLRNPTDHPVTVVGALYLVQVHRTAPARPKQSPVMASGRQRRYAVDKGSRVVDRGPALKPGSILEAGEEVARHFVSFAPPGYNGASLRVDLALARPRLKQEGLTTTHPRAHDVWHLTGKIDDSSWLHAVTRSGRYTHVVNAPADELGCNPPVEVVAYVDGRREADSHRWCDEPRRMDEHYGIRVEQFSAETRLVDGPG
jgi:hypothetical protein